MKVSASSISGGRATASLAARLVVVATTAVILCFGGIPMAFAGPERISAALPLSVRLTDGRSFGATRIRLGWNDLLEIVGPSGQTTSIAAVRVAEIEDGEGNDLTRLVLDGHEVIGTGGQASDTLGSVPISEFMTEQSVRPPRRPPLSGFLIQGAYLIRVGKSKEFVDTGYGVDGINRVLFQAEIGGMGRIGENYGVGLSLLLGGNDDFTVLGIKARARRMLGFKTQLDIASGYMRQIPADGVLRESESFVGEVTLMADGWIGAMAQFQTVELDDVNGGSKTELWWYFGPRIGGIPGIPAVVITLLAVAISQTAE